MRAPSIRTFRHRAARLTALGVAVGSLLGGFTVMSGGSPAGAAGNLYVSNYGHDAGNNCSVSSDPCLTLLHAYNTAGNGATIHLAPGTFTVNYLNVQKNINIVGSNSGGSLNATTTTIDAEGHSAGLAIYPFTVNISNVVIDGSSSELISTDGTTTFTNVEIGSTTDGPPFLGTAVLVDGGTFKMVGGSISGATAPEYGAGLVADDGGTATLDNVTLTHDAVTGPDGEGGAIFVSLSSTVKLTGTTNIRNNSATAEGGGIFRCASGVVTVGPNVSIVDNTPNNIGTLDIGGWC
jgi:hypothetical protein